MIIRVKANPPSRNIQWRHNVSVPSSWNSNFTFFVPQGRPLLQDKTAGIIISGNSLAIQVLPDSNYENVSSFLQRIRRKFIGNYSCSAVNDLGVGRSNRLPLDIKCQFSISSSSKYSTFNLDSPACSPDQQFVYSVAKMSEVEVSCQMIANPESDLDFKWTFNTTANTLSIPVSLTTVWNSNMMGKFY